MLSYHASHTGPIKAPSLYRCVCIVQSSPDSLNPNRLSTSSACIKALCDNQAPASPFESMKRRKWERLESFMPDFTTSFLWMVNLRCTVTADHTERSQTPPVTGLAQSTLARPSSAVCVPQLYTALHHSVYMSACKVRKVSPPYSTKRA